MKFTKLTPAERRDIYFSAWTVLEEGWNHTGLCYLLDEVLREKERREHLHHRQGSYSDIFPEFMKQEPFKHYKNSDYWWSMGDKGDKPYDKKSRQQALLNAINLTYETGKDSFTPRWKDN